MNSVSFINTDLELHVVNEDYFTVVGMTADEVCQTVEELNMGIAYN